MTRPIETLAPVALLSPAKPSAPAPDVDAYALEATMRSLISLGQTMSMRSRQRAIGASEIGRPCSRRLAYKLADTRPVNVTDPLRALVGSGVHAVMADIFRQLDAGSGRYLVEAPIRYRGVPGTCDLFDRLTGTVIDWKTTLKAKIGRLRADGPSPEYVTQVQTYAAGLIAAGEDVRAVALVFVPVDSGLSDLWAWRGALDVARVDAAIDRLNEIAGAQLEAVAGQVRPSTVDPTPSNLCRFCDYHNPKSTDQDHACKGSAT